MATAAGLKNSADHDATKVSKVQLELIAICGLGMRLPGLIHDAAAFWDVLLHGKDMTAPVPGDRYNAKGFENTMGKKGIIKSTNGYFLDEDLSCFDASSFSMTKKSWGTWIRNNVSSLRSHEIA